MLIPTATPEPSRPKNNNPPFLRHSRVSKEPTSKPYTPGDTKDHKGVSWTFCGCPKHQFGVRWHQHKLAECKVLKDWLSEHNLSLESYINGSRPDQENVRPAAHL